MTGVRIRRWAAARRAALASEDGFIIVIVMMLIVIGLLAGAAALSETLDARTSANRSERSARALQAADAGIQTELYRANQLNFGLLKLTSGLSLSSIVNQLLTCPIPQVNASGQVTGIQFTAIASIGSPCPANGSSGVTSPLNNEEPVGDHSYFETQFVPGTTNIGDFVQFSPKIVASGVDDNNGTQVSRRVEAILAPVAPWRTLEAGHNLTFDVPPAVSVLGLKLAGATAFNGTAAAGNNLTIDGAASLVSTFTALNAGGSGLTEPSALDYCGTYSHPNMTIALTLGTITQPSSNCSSLVSRPTISIKSTQGKLRAQHGRSHLLVAVRQLDVEQPRRAVQHQRQHDNHVPARRLRVLQLRDQRSGEHEPELDPGRTDLHRQPQLEPLLGIHEPLRSWPSELASRPRRATSSRPRASGWNALTGTLSTTHPSQVQIYVTGNGTNDGTAVTSTGSTALSGQSMFLYAADVERHGHRWPDMHPRHVRQRRHDRGRLDRLRPRCQRHRGHTGSRPAELPALQRARSVLRQAVHRVHAAVPAPLAGSNDRLLSTPRP